MLMSKLGIITDEVSPHLEEALDFATDHGLTHVEIRTVEGRNAIDLSDEELKRVHTAVQRRGLFVSCFSSPVFKCALDVNRAVQVGDVFSDKGGGVEEHFHKLTRAIEIARQLRTRNVRIFSFWREFHPEEHTAEIVQYLKQAAALAMRHDVMLLLENEPACNAGYASEVNTFVCIIDSPALKALWDPGNEAYGLREAFPSGYQAIKQTVEHVHLKDVRIDEFGKPHCVPIGSGIVPYDLQLKALHDDGYNGLFTLEPHYIPQGGTAKDGSELTLKGLLRKDYDG